MIRFARSPSLLLLAATIGLAGSARAQGVPSKATSLARCVPKDNLVALVEFDGLDAHQAAWKASAAYKLLNETSLGALLEDLATQLLNKALASRPASPPKPSAEQLIGAFKFLARKGMVVGVYGKSPEPPNVVIAVRGATSVPGEKAVGFLRAMMDASPGRTYRDVKGRKLAIVDDGAFWSEGEDLVITLPPIENSGIVMAVLDGNRPSAADHPIRVELVKAEDGFTPVLRAFVDMGQFGPPPPPAVALGVDGLKRIDLRMGFQDDAIVTNIRALAPSPRRGVLAILDNPTFSAQTLPPVPAGISAFTAMSIDLDATFARYVELMKTINSPEVPAIDQFEQKFQKVFGLRFREDVLAHLGPKMAFYTKATAGTVPMGFGMTMAIPEVTITAETDDPAAFGKALDAIMNLAIQQLKNPAIARPGQPMPTLRKLADAPGYELILPPQMAQGPLASIRPTLLVGKGIVAISSTKAAAQAALGLGGKPSARWTPPPAFAAMAKRLPKDMIFLNVHDPRDSVPQLIANLPTLVPILDNAMRGANPNAAGGEPFLRVDPSKVPAADALAARLAPGSLAVAVDDQGWKVVTRDAFPTIGSPASSGVAIALLLPAVQAAREAARRTQCTNNLKQIMLAMLNYESANGHYPPAAIRDKSGKPLLSWRVAILPYLEYGNLYNEFHLDEPWDSPHNLALAEQMPKAYLCPSRRAEPNTTSYRVVNGPGSLFDDPKGVPIAGVMDGTVSTIAVAEFKEAVPWTKPDDVPLDATTATLFGSDHPGGFNAALADGSVRFFKATVDPTLLKKLLTRNGGEIVQLP